MQHGVSVSGFRPLVSGGHVLARRRAGGPGGGRAREITPGAGTSRSHPQVPVACALRLRLELAMPSRHNPGTSAGCMPYQFLSILSCALVLCRDMLRSTGRDCKQASIPDRGCCSVLQTQNRTHLRFSSSGIPRSEQCCGHHRSVCGSRV